MGLSHTLCGSLPVAPAPTLPAPPRSESGAGEYQEVVNRAEKENWSYRDFLALLLAEEVAHRNQTRLQRCTRQAHFPFFKTIDEFDFTLQSTLRQSLLGSYLGPDFVTEGRSLILYGKEGRGKTHLAVAIGYRVIQNGFETLCTTAAKLIEHLSNASAKGLLHQSLSTYTRPHNFIIDTDAVFARKFAPCWRMTSAPMLSSSPVEMPGRRPAFIASIVLRVIAPAGCKPIRSCADSMDIG
jgi:hypothetical protein